MSKHMTGMMAVVLTAAAMLFTAPAFADHRPGNVVVMGGTMSLTGRRHIERARRIHNARKLYLEGLNARGGLLGHKVEYKIYDDGAATVNYYRPLIELYVKLITEDKVDLVLGPFGSNMKIGRSAWQSLMLQIT